jgi:hypothetical protein
MLRGTWPLCLWGRPTYGCRSRCVVRS